MDRRTFLEIVGATSATVLTGCNDAPRDRVHSYLTPPHNTVPGVATYYATVCRTCPAGCGVIAKTREARPIKLEGNPAHPVNRGALCARGQAALEGLYGRHRVREPMMRVEGKLVAVTWQAALSEVAQQLGSAKSVGLMTGLESGSFEDLVTDLRSCFSQLVHVAYEPLSLRSLATASRIVFGVEEVPHLSLSDADFVLSLGADYLDTWVSPVEFSRQWSDRHGYGPHGRRLRMEYVGPRRNLTATAADHFHHVPPDAVGPVAVELLVGLLGAKHGSWAEADLKIVAEHLQRLAPLAGGTPSDVLAGFLALAQRRAGAEPAKVALPVSELNRIVARLASAKAPIVLFGGSEVATVEATAIHVAVLLSNYLTGAIGTALRYGSHHAQTKVDPASAAYELIGSAGAGRLDVLVLHGTNPVYAMPGGLDVAEKLAAAKFVVALACEHNETTAQAHVVLPVHHPLESWGDYQVTDTIIGLMQPVRAPLVGSRHGGDVLLDLARRAGKTVRRETFKQIISDRWARRKVRDLQDVLVMGGIFEPTSGAPPRLVRSGDTDGSRVTRIVGNAFPPVDGVALIVSSSARHYDGRQVSHDWLFEAPDSLDQGTWEVPVQVALDVAKAHGIATGDSIRVTRARAAFNATAVVDEDLWSGTVACAFGGGSRFAREPFLSGNVMELLGPVVDPVSGELAYVQARVGLQRVGPGTFASVSGGTDTQERLLCLTMSARDARAGRYPILTEHGEEIVGAPAGGSAVVSAMPEQEMDGRRPDDNFYELQRFPEHRWGMVVDLDRCTGCGSCVVACYAENNVPVVGREQILKGRELSWIRIEKHVIGSGRERKVAFLPVMCQHCAQAPCESVCPVFASYHTLDGLNAQIYNRCIGTRYCANNCPYKVRRFNWFDWRRDPPGNEQLNPDVTVRSRGVMEKCTFCIQRIRDATGRAKVEGRGVRDGEIRPACVQTCPTGALTFGDFKQPRAIMTRLARDRRGYRLLDSRVNTKPSVVYLRKVYSDPEDA